MRAIANGQLEGFPPKEELRTVYVEHDIDASEADTPVVDFVHADPILQGALFWHHFSVHAAAYGVRGVLVDNCSTGPFAAALHASGMCCFIRLAFSALDCYF